MLNELMLNNNSSFIVIGTFEYIDMLGYDYVRTCPCIEIYWSQRTDVIQTYLVKHLVSSLDDKTH